MEFLYGIAVGLCFTIPFAIVLWTNSRTFVEYNEALGRDDGRDG